MTKTKSTVANPKVRKPRKPTSKTELLIRLLRAKGGADLDKISTKLGWQIHTTRAAISRLRKGGQAVTLDKCGGKTRYLIASDAEADHGA